VRFSNASGTVQDDTKKDVRGVAIKLLGVPGPKLLDGAEACSNHDLILISTDVFVVRGVAEFDELVRTLTGPRWRLPPYLVMHPRVAWRLFTSLAHHPSPVAIRYFSFVPYLFGSVAAKYSLTPVEPVSTDMPHAPSAPSKSLSLSLSTKYFIASSGLEKLFDAMFAAPAAPPNTPSIESTIDGEHGRQNAEQHGRHVFLFNGRSLLSRVLLAHIELCPAAYAKRRSRRVLFAAVFTKHILSSS
jgi:hypothetical protein